MPCEGPLGPQSLMFGGKGRWKRLGARERVRIPQAEARGYAGPLGAFSKRAQRACGQGPVLKRISGMRHRAPDRAHEVLAACGGVCELASGCLGHIVQVGPYGARAGPPGAALSVVITFWPSPVAVSV